ncbi:DDB1- and CUL4-associated factor 15-like [Dreissena polymorpha]|uniref:DDB1- and CUL4-associated factor 15 WD40 repeat-containing domain-containing protein n=1 Tax=Dreissena polymorpha TaxID=45954 RepID=A0A9D4L8V4_DREPO|nr:DDB1- and CUL4-associated factor 15-like [Dreissena polymorpha]KAH3853973.1 hypothetical protein DPMN_096511 [Dreissena polymorpha]
MSYENKSDERDPSLLTKLYNREIHGSDRIHRKARPQRLFKKIPKRLCYRLSALIPQSVLETEGYVFLGFTKCGQFVVSYTCHMDAEEQSGLPCYMFKLQWWWFVPSRPLVKVSEVQLFGEVEILQDLYIMFCEWPEDRTQVVVFGHSLPRGEQESCQCYLTVTAIPSLAPCKQCRDLQTSPDDKTLCLKHSFCLHTKYELTPPFPIFFPRVQLKCDGQVIINTGDSVVALHIDLDGMEHKPEGASVLKVKELLVSDKSKEMVCTSPEPNREFVWNTGTSNSLPLSVDCPQLSTESLPSVSTSSYKTEQVDNLDLTLCADHESQKENTSFNNQDFKLERIKSPPKSPKSSLSQNQRSPVMVPEKWFDSINLPHCHSTSNPPVSIQSPSSRKARSISTASAEIHTRDLYNFDSDDSEDNSYSFMCPSVPKVTLKAKSPSGSDVVSHPHNLVISPSVHLQRQLAFSVNKASPLLNNSQALNCPTSAESPKLTFEHIQSTRGIFGLGRSFFSPSNSENSFGGTSSSAESVIVQVNDARTVTHSWRKFSYHGDAAVDSTLVIEDDFDLTYRSVLPAEVRGTKNRQLSLSLDPANDGHKEQICVKQLTFDIEHYMEEAIRSAAPWADRYIAFTNYDLQILDVYPDRNEVLAKVFALISAREDGKKRKFYKRSKSPEKLYQTSFTFELNIQSGVYETLVIEDLSLMDDKDLRSKDWKPGFRENALLRRQVFIPQSLKRSVHVLSNEAVFKGKSLQMILFPEHFTALVL